MNPCGRVGGATLAPDSLQQAVHVDLFLANLPHVLENLLFDVASLHQLPHDLLDLINVHLVVASSEEHTGHLLSTQALQADARQTQRELGEILEEALPGHWIVIVTREQYLALLGAGHVVNDWVLIIRVHDQPRLRDVYIYIYMCVYIYIYIYIYVDHVVRVPGSRDSRAPLCLGGFRPSERRIRSCRTPGCPDFLLRELGILNVWNPTFTVSCE